MKRFVDVTESDWLVFFPSNKKSKNCNTLAFLKLISRRAWGCLFLLCPPIVQMSGRFKTTHTGWYPSAKAYEEVRRFETTLYGALLRGQSKKRYLHARFPGFR